MRRSVIATLVAAVVLLSPVAAWAHVEVEPAEAPKGGSDVTLTFPIPNEKADAGTVKVELQIPTDHPLLGVKAVAYDWLRSVALAAEVLDSELGAPRGVTL